MSLNHTFTLANGTTVTKNAGDPLPLGLSDDFSVQLIPEEFIKSVNHPIFIGTTLKCLGDSINIIKKSNMSSRLTVLYGATRCVNEFMPRCDEVYKKLPDDPKAVQEWQDFCDDVTILASYKLWSGASLRILLERPQLTKKYIAGVCYLLDESHFTTKKKLDFKNSRRCK